MDTCNQKVCTCKWYDQSPAYALKGPTGTMVIGTTTTVPHDTLAAEQSAPQSPSDNLAIMDVCVALESFWCTNGWYEY